MKIIIYDNIYRNQVIEIWKNIFGYKEARNNPDLIINKKLSINDKLFFIATENEKVIGTIMAGYDGHRGWIYSVAVIPDYRNQKIGSKLLKYAENELKNLGCIKINLQILQTNQTVKNFYVKNGYNIEERISMGKEITENIK
jgi:ribosomal protein S18 acetylase RimI-like enzyme